MSRASTLKALNRFCDREAKRASRPSRKNNKPEFELKKKFIAWLDVNCFECDVVESKGVYNFAAGRYDHGQTKAGFSDIVGVTPYHGVACFIELKAPGKRGTLKSHQRDFLMRKIRREAFAVCTDSIEHFVEIYEVWRRLRSQFKIKQAENFLMMSLPDVKSVTDNLDDIIGVD